MNAPTKGRGIHVQESPLQSSPGRLRTVQLRERTEIARRLVAAIDRRILETRLHDPAGHERLRILYELREKYLPSTSSVH